MEFVDVFLTNGTFPLMRIWKHLVYDTIRKYELSEWTQRLNDDDEFDSFKSKHQEYQPHPAWTIALSHPHLRKQAHYIISLCCLIRNTTNNFYVTSVVNFSMTRVFTPQHHATIYQTFAINFGLKL